MWLDDPGRRREPAPALQGDTEADVVVVGAGIVGLTTALLAARDGMRVVVLEARRIGDGTTGYATGKVTAQHSLIYARLVAWAGVDRARQYADANRAGIDLVADLAEELDIDCSPTRADALVYTTSDEATSIRAMEDEAVAAHRLALPATLVNESGLPFAITAGVRFTDQLHVHPRRYLDGLADALVAAGGTIHEHSRVTHVGEAHGRVTADTEGGTVEAASAVVATLLPIGLLGGYFAHPSEPVLRTGRAPAPRGAPRHDDLGRRAGALDAPLARRWARGADRRGRRARGRRRRRHGGRYADLEQWTRETFEVAEVSHRWSAHDYVTPDRVPYVGRSRSTSTSMSPPASASGAVQRQRGWSHAQRPARRPRAGLAAGLQRAPHRRHAIGANPRHRQPQGRRELVTGELRREAPRCSHMGCRLRWNVAEETWDCHCHGSRFSSDGQVLAGPAVKPIDVDGAGRGCASRLVPDGSACAARTVAHQDERCRMPLSRLDESACHPVRRRTGPADPCRRWAAGTRHRWVTPPSRRGEPPRVALRGRPAGRRCAGTLDSRRRSPRP